MLETYKCRCCKNCRWVDVYNDSDRTRICRYYGNAIKTVDDDDICAGWEPNGAVSETQFRKPHEDDVVNTYDVSMRITVRGKESQMRYAEAVKTALQDFADCEMAESEMGGEYTVLHASVDHVQVHDPGAEP